MVAQMKAGEELETAIANKIFGVQPIRPGDVSCIFWEFDNDRFGRCMFGGDCHFSRHIASAWRVVEKLKEQGYYLCLECDSQGQGGNLWKATFDGQASAFVTAETAPLAICLAALKVGEGDEDGQIRQRNNR